LWLAINHLGALGKRGDHRIADLIEHGAEGQAGQRAGHFELQIERNLARILAQRHEIPDAFEVGERAFEQRDGDLAAGIDCVPGRKRFFEAALRNDQFGFDDIALALQDPAAGAPGQKFRVRLDVVDQVEHLLRRKFDQGAFLYDGHTQRTPTTCRNTRNTAAGAT